MEQIKIDTKDISPLFWKDFELNKDTRFIRNNYINDVLHSDNIVTEALKIKISLEDFCDILILLLKSSDGVYNGLSDSLNILSIMCIYSSLIRELNKFEKHSLKPYLESHNKSLNINLLEDFIDIFNSFEDVLDNYQTNDGDPEISKEIDKSINKTKELYLRLCQNI